MTEGESGSGGGETTVGKKHDTSEKIQEGARA
jgi:hypothetical protein